LNNQTVSCTPGETLQLSIQPIAYAIGCATHSFSWNFGDGTQSVSGQEVTHAFSGGGAFNVTVTVTNPQQNLQVPATIRVSGTPPPPNPGPTQPGPNNCGTMDSGKTYIQYTAPSGCNQNSGSTPCIPNESVLMSVGFFAYDDTCATHTYTWDFGDNTPGATGRSVTHQYAAGNYTAKVTVNNGKQSFTATAPVNVGIAGGGNFQPDFTYFADVFDPFLIAFSPTVTPASTPITKVSWDFGDGTQLTKNQSTLQGVTNTYIKAGTYTVTLTIYSNNNLSAVKSRVITVTSPSRTRGVRH
jgi:PKD repeat protein